jgi:hypothetical protein
MNKTSKKSNSLTTQLQLTFLYFLALFDLSQNTLRQLAFYDTPLKLLIPFFITFKKILEFKALKILTNSEHIFLVMFFVVEIFIVRSLFNLSNIVKYNLLLVLLLFLLQGIISLYVDLFGNTDLLITANILIKKDLFLTSHLTNFFTINQFIIFFIGYIYLYINAIFGNFTTIPFFESISDSMAFWLHLKTKNISTGTI